MTTPDPVTMSLKIDAEAGAAYLLLSSEKVSTTVEFSDVIYIDLDHYGVVVGIELLDLGTPLPLDELDSRYHINASALELLKSHIKWAPQRLVATTASSARTPSVFSSGKAARC